MHGNRYIGSTDNIEARVNRHNKGKSKYTKGRRPWRLVYSEEYNTRREAMAREKILKSGQGRKWLDEILAKTHHGWVPKRSNGPDCKSGGLVPS